MMKFTLDLIFVDDECSIFTYRALETSVKLPCMARCLCRYSFLLHLGLSVGSARLLMTSLGLTRSPIALSVPAQIFFHFAA